jgi:PAS domain S-box-containing protein
MSMLALVTSVLALLGSVFMAMGFIQGRKIGGNVPPGLRREWTTIVVLMLFFLTGYLALVAVLVSQMNLPTELITGPVFLGGAFFVFIVIRLSRTTIGRLAETEGELRHANDSLERRVAERTRELERSHAFLRTALDSQYDAIVIINVENLKIVTANVSFLNEYGLTMEQAVEKTCHEVTHGSSEACASPDDICPLYETLKTGCHSVAEHVHVDVSGRKRYVEVSTSPIRDQEGKIIEVVHITRDVTDRRHAEDALRQSEEQLKNILDSIQAGIMVINPRDHRIVDVNSFAAKLISAPKEEIIGRVCHEFVCPAQKGSCPITDRHQVVDNAERVLIRADGTRMPILKSVIPVQFRGTEHLIERFIDITPIMKAKEDLAQLNDRLLWANEDLHEVNEELKSFAHIVSHDLRAPLMNIRGFSEELGRSLAEIGPCLEKHLPLFDEAEKKRIGPLLKQDIPQALDFIRSSVSRMDGQINAILKLSRAGRRNLSPEPLQTGEIVRGILQTLRHQLESHAVAVTVDGLPDLVADRMAIEQIFGNLLDNAVKYLDPARPGAIAVTAEQGAQEIIVHVRDNGRGMVPEDIPKAFELFRRVGNHDVPGDGMGLAYVRALVRSMGGRIWCRSELNKGTTFSFSVPAGTVAANRRNEEAVPEQNALPS